MAFVVEACKYCENGYEELFSTDRGYIGIDFEKRRIELDDYYTKNQDDGYNINFCPFCGREL